MCSICNCFSLQDGSISTPQGAIFVCGRCGEGICEGERYYNVGKSYFHKECLTDDCCNEELLSLFGVTPRVATRDVISLRIVGVENGEQGKSK